jgi:hypothetical protein
MSTFPPFISNLDLATKTICATARLVDVDDLDMMLKRGNVCEQRGDERVAVGRIAKVLAADGEVEITIRLTDDMALKKTAEGVRIGCVSTAEGACLVNEPHAVLKSRGGADLRKSKIDVGDLVKSVGASVTIDGGAPST